MPHRSAENAAQVDFPGEPGWSACMLSAIAASTMHLSGESSGIVLLRDTSST